MPNLRYTGPVGDPAPSRYLKTRYLKTDIDVKNGILLKALQTQGEKKVTEVGTFLFLLVKGLKLFYITQNAITF